MRHGRVAAGLAELERWVADQIRQGLATSAEHDWDGLAKRLIDAQAPGVAGVVSRLVQVRAEDNWPGRLLEEYALINLLAVASTMAPTCLGPWLRPSTSVPVFPSREKRCSPGSRSATTGTCSAAGSDRRPVVRVPRLETETERLTPLTGLAHDPKVALRRVHQRVFGKPRPHMG